MPEIKQTGVQFRELKFDIKPDVESRVFSIPVSSEAPVERWWGTEILDHSAEAVDMSRLQDGAPLLLDHDPTRQIGVIEGASVSADKRLNATIRFSRSALGEEVMQDVMDGIRRNVSIGYRIDSLQEVSKDTYLANRWLPMEISVVSVPADAGVGFGRGADDYNPLDLLTQQRSPAMSDPIEETPVDETAPVPEIVAEEVEAPVDAEEIRAASAKAERARIARINEVGTRAAVDPTVIKRFIDAGTPADEASQEILRMWSEKVDQQVNTPHIEAGLSSEDKFRAGAVAALAHRAGFEKDDPSNEFRGKSLHELGARALEMKGHKVSGMTRSEIAGMLLRGHSTSDFPLLLADVANKSLQSAYGIYPQIWNQIAAVGSVSDFKTINMIRMGSFSSLSTIVEGAEYTQGSFSEEREQLTAVTKGKYIQMTRQMIINDDLSGFSRMANMLGRAAARTVNADVLGVLTTNGALSDNVALFHADHSNLAGSGAAISVATLGAGRAAMRKQKDASGLDATNIMPRYLLVPVGKEDMAREIVTSPYNTDTAGQLKNNSIRSWSPLEVISDPLLDDNSATAWYLIADPMDAPLLEVRFLDGQQTPYVASEEEFMTDAVRWKVRLDYGVAANDYRGGYKNAGA
jgi:hypothetical protein